MDESTLTKPKSMYSMAETSPHNETHDSTPANENKDFTTNMNFSDIVFEATSA